MEKRGKEKKAGIIPDSLVEWVIAILVLVLCVIVYIVLSGKWEAFTKFIANIFRFGR